MKIPFELKTEDKLLIYLAQTSIDPETKNKVKIIVAKTINWDYLLKKSSHHRLRPLIYSNLKKYSDTIPEDVLNFLKDYSFRNTQKNLLFMGELFKLLTIFKNNNIITIPYKGPIMAFQGYGNISLREFDDLDLFIDKKDFPKVKQILANENYETVLKLNSSKEAKYMESQREFKFKNSFNKVKLEVHWNVAGVSFSFPTESYFPINPELNPISINNQNLNVFSDEDIILILSLHAAGHLWSRLSWICDIAELIKRSEELNWEKIIEKAGYLAIERILYLNLSISNKIFDLKLPGNIKDNIKADSQVEILEKRIMKLIFSPKECSVLSQVCLRFKLRENKLNGFKDILRILTIPRSDEWMALNNNGPKIFLYTFKRPLQIIKRLKE